MSAPPSRYRVSNSLEKVISGGQTGADRGALDAALEAGFPAGGYCPEGRKAEDGMIDARYPLVEYGKGYAPRTRKNVEMSDGTIVFYDTVLSGGTLLTINRCNKAGKPFRLIDISLLSYGRPLMLDGNTTEELATGLILDFIRTHRAVVLNVAGPRESNCPGMQAFVKSVVYRVLT